MKNTLKLSMLGLMMLSLASCGLRMSTYADADKYTAGNIEYSDTTITNLDIDWLSGKVTLVEDESASGVTIYEETNLTEEKALVHTYLNNGTLNVKFFASGYHCSSYSIRKELTITYRPGLDELRIDLTSGSINATELHANKFDLDITSGSANIGNLVAEDVDIDLTSGSVNIDKVATKNFDADMTSGRINVKFEALEKATFDLTSGKIDMTLPTDGGKVKVSKTSGTVIASRECTIKDNIYTFGTGLADIKVSMTSGTLLIA